MPRNFATDALGLTAFLLLAFAAAAIGGLATGSSVDTWYPTLDKPDWQPPDRLFGPVWTTLYLTIGLAGWCAWRQRTKRDIRPAMALYTIQLILNAGWSLIFFGLRQPGWAMIEITALWLAIAATAAAFFPLSRVAGWLLMPYLAWVTFAGALNFEIWRLNTGG